MTNDILSNLDYIADILLYEYEHNDIEYLDGSKIKRYLKSVPIDIDDSEYDLSDG